MEDQAFKLLIGTLKDIKSDIDDLRTEVRDHNRIITKMKAKVIAIATIIPFLVSMTYKKVDTPPKAIPEKVEQVLKELKAD